MMMDTQGEMTGRRNTHQRDFCRIRLLPAQMRRPPCSSLLASDTRASSPSYDFAAGPERQPLQSETLFAGKPDRGAFPARTLNRPHMMPTPRGPQRNAAVGASSRTTEPTPGSQSADVDRRTRKSCVLSDWFVSGRADASTGSDTGNCSEKCDD